MTDAAQIPTDEQVEQRWLQMASLIDQMMQRVGTPGEFTVEPGSSLAGDDAASSPYQVSHVVRTALAVGTDNLHAIKTLVIDAGKLHSSAPFVLARGALENYIAASWVLMGKDREARVVRALRIEAQNYKDQEKAVGALNLPDHEPLETKMQKLEAVLQRQSINKSISGGYSATEAAKDVDTVTGNLDLNVLLAWQLCSGFAHGRRWAYLGASNLKEHATADPGVMGVEVTSELWRVLYPVQTALLLLQELMRRYRGDAAAASS